VPEALGQKTPNTGVERQLMNIGPSKSTFANVTTWGPKALACTREIVKDHDAILYVETHLKEEEGKEVQKALSGLGLRGKLGNAKQSDRSKTGYVGGVMQQYKKHLTVEPSGAKKELELTEEQGQDWEFAGVGLKGMAVDLGVVYLEASTGLAAGNLQRLGIRKHVATRGRPFVLIGDFNVPLR